MGKFKTKFEFHIPSGYSGVIMKSLDFGLEKMGGLAIL